jgi:hypothetical protein
MANADQYQPTEAEVLAQLQIGPTWDKVETAKNLVNLPASLQKAALSIANFKHGTAFYVGKFNGLYVMATNAHVVSNKINDLLPERIHRLSDDPSLICTSGQTGSPTELVRFDLQKRTFECDKLIGVWPSIELSLFSIKVSAADDSFFDNIGVKLDFATPPMRGRRLIAFGYGEFMNPGESDVALMETAGPFCKTFSRSGELRLMNDPDEHNPGPYKVWSFAVGCNVAWGDSGSPVLDKSTGKAVGVIWTARYPKGTDVKNAMALETMISNQPLEVWSQLSYASPAIKIREVLRAELKEGKLTPDTALIVEDMLEEK